MGLTASGLSPVALATIVLSVVTACTVIVAVIGVLIDRSAERHERAKDR